MTSPPEDTSLRPQAHGELLSDIKLRIHSARVGAGLAVKRVLIELYWKIGNEILRRERTEGWGLTIIDRLAAG
jgi:hypothetical protein